MIAIFSAPRSARRPLPIAKRSRGARLASMVRERGTLCLSACVALGCGLACGDPPTSPDGGESPPTYGDPGCFEAIDTPPLSDGSLDVLEGAARPVADPVGYELCSRSAGLSAGSDAHQLAFLRERGDLDMTTTLRAVQRGSAALVVRTDEQAADRARVAVGVTRTDRGSTIAFVRVRRDDGSAEETVVEGPEVSLPVRLRLVREVDGMEAHYAEGEGPFVALWSDTVAGSRLVEHAVIVGLAQSSDDETTSATATFGPLFAARPDAPPPDVPECAPVTVPDGSDIVLGGSNLDGVVQATIAGVPATVDTQPDGGLRLRKRPGRAKFGFVELESEDWGTLRVRGQVTAGGRPFVRGDVDGDGSVDTDDVVALTEAVDGLRTVIGCAEAADVDDDGDIDLDDAEQLRTHLASGGPPPAPPWPDPGARDGDLVCDDAAVPLLVDVRAVDGSAIPAGTVLREGDELLVIGADLPDPG